VWKPFCKRCTDVRITYTLSKCIKVQGTPQLKRNGAFRQTLVDIFPALDKAASLVLSVLVVPNNARQVLVIDLEDDRERISLPSHQNITCGCVHMRAGR